MFLSENKYLSESFSRTFLATFFGQFVVRCVASLKDKLVGEETYFKELGEVWDYMI